MVTWIEVEIIPVNPTLEIFLDIENIPLMDIFYSLVHKVVVKGGRKKRNIVDS